jgi:hypothetical protein
MEPVSVAVPTAQLLQKAKAVLPEDLLLQQHITAKFLKEVYHEQLTAAVFELKESLSKEPSMREASELIMPLLEPFIIKTLESDGKRGRELFPTIALGFSADEAIELGTTNNGAKGAQQKGKDDVQQIINQSQNHSTTSFYQFLMTVAYTYKYGFLNFGYCYIHRDDHVMSQFLSDNKDKKMAAMKIECVSLLAEALRSASPDEIILVPNDDMFKDQASLLE